MYVHIYASSEGSVASRSVWGVCVGVSVSERQGECAFECACECKHAFSEGCVSAWVRKKEEPEGRREGG